MISSEGSCDKFKLIKIQICHHGNKLHCEMHYRKPVFDLINAAMVSITHFNKNLTNLKLLNCDIS